MKSALKGAIEQTHTNKIELSRVLLSINLQLKLISNNQDNNPKRTTTKADYITMNCERYARIKTN